MFKKPWLYASLASIALIGCATTQGTDSARAACSGNRCEVKIDVAPNCGFTITPDPLIVLGQGNRKEIEWEIVSGNFRFRTEGIEIKLPDGEFDGQQLVDTDRKKFKWNNKHRKSGQYYYWIHVESASGGPLKCSIDPLIVNE